MEPSELQKLKIAVVGAGYGGASAAKALSLLGADVTVYEQARQIRELGAGIGLRPSTMQQFRRWGSFDAVAAVSSPSDFFEARTATGEPILKEPWPGIEDDPTLKTHLIHRGDFIDALVSVLPEGMIRLGHKLSDIEDLGDQTKLTFTNGETATADVVVAADGIRSTVRARLFEDKPPVFSGEIAFRLVVNAEDAYGLVTDDNFRMYIGRGGTKVYFLPLRHRNQVSFDVTIASSDSDWSPKATKEDLLAAMEGFDERLVNIARNLDMDTVNIRSAYDIDPIDVWHTDSVVLIGDAAHAMLHHQGQGANSAILDARGLTDALEEAGSVKEALALFQATRKPVTDELQRHSRQNWDEGAVEDPFAAQKSATPIPV